MKKQVLWVLTSLTLLASSAQAYDSDTHLRMTYAAARHAGINHEVSLMLAMADQWIDVSALTTPMGSLMIGTRLRRLFHFPTSRSMRIDNRDSHGRLDFNTVTKAVRMDPMGAELLSEGMKTGNLLMVGAGLHTLQDTFGHEGWLAEVGHASGGHEPDRPWRNWDKYKEMNLNIFRAMISIRKLLPPEALDMETPKKTGAWSAKIDINSAESLTQDFLDHVSKIANNNIFADPRYTVPAVDFLLKNLQEMKFFKAEIDTKSLVDASLHDGSMDIHLIFKEVVKKAYAMELQGIEVFDRKVLFSDILRGYGLDSNSKDVFQTISTWPEDIRTTVLNRIVSKVLDAHVPDTIGKSSLGTSNHFVWEPSGELRNLEMKLRMNDWRELTVKMYQSDWHFDEARNNILLKEIVVNPIVYLKIGVGKFFGLVKAGALKVAGKKQKTELEVGKAAAAELEKYVKGVYDVSPDTELVTMPKDYRKRWVGMILNFAWFDWVKGNNRFKAGENNLAFLFADTFNKLIAKGEVKALINEKELKALANKMTITEPKLIEAIKGGVLAAEEAKKSQVRTEADSVLREGAVIRSCKAIYGM